jgi:large subunit ribosomal protein L20
MARVKRGTKGRIRKKRTLDMVEGYYGRRKNCYTIAAQSLDRALATAYVGRKQRKRNFRSLWITRINAAARSFGITYSKLIPLMEKAGLAMDRKILAEIAVSDPKGFEQIVAAAKAAA